MMTIRLHVICVGLITLLFAAPLISAQVTVTNANPSAVAPGASKVNINISGSGFKRGAATKFNLSGTNNPGDITVNSTTYVSSSQVVANISVSSTAADNTYDIAVTNTNGSSGKGTELLGVNKNANSSGGINVTSTIFDTDVQGNQLLFRSDDYYGTALDEATYTETSNTVSSIFSDFWELDLRSQATRNVWITFSQPVSGSPTSPLSDGLYNAVVHVRCYDASNNIVSMFGIPFGSTNNRCSLRIGLPPTGHNNWNYVLVMAPIFDGTGYSNVTCTAGNSTGCTAWHVEPNRDGVDFPGNVPTVSGLYVLSANGNMKLIGYYYNTYRIDFTE